MDFKVPRTRYIKLVGIELEGGWKMRRDFDVYEDGSVYNIPNSIAASDHNEDDDYYDDEGSCSCPDCLENRGETGRDRLIAGEICSPPMPLREAVNWMLDSYPDAHNATCGMHVHVSVRSLYRYAQLMDQRFHKHWRQEFYNWAKPNIRSTDFWNRWNGDVGDRTWYCSDEWRADDQAVETDKNGNRYTALNYCWGFGGPRRPRKTMECRLFPIFRDKTVAAAAICAHARIIEDYLSNMTKEHRREPVVEEELSVQELPKLGEEIELCV